MPAIEAAMLKYHNKLAYKEFAECKENGTLPESNELIEPTVPELIAMQFIDPDRPYERLEMYRMRLERGLDTATRHLERLREQTKGAEICHHRKVEYEVAHTNKVIQRYQESEAQRSAAERAAAENAPKDMQQPDGNSKPAKEMQNHHCAMPIKAISSLDTAQVCPDTPDLLKVNPNVSTTPLTP